MFWSAYLIGIALSAATPFLILALVLRTLRRGRSGPSELTDPGQATPPDWLAQIQQLGTQVPLAPSYVATMQQLHTLIEQARLAQHQGSPPPMTGVPVTPSSPRLQAQFEAKLAHIQREMAAHDRLTNERLELSKARMLSQASEAGIDVGAWGPF